MDELFSESNKKLEFASPARSSLQSKLDQQEIDTPRGASLDDLFKERVQRTPEVRASNQPKTLPAIMSMLSAVLGNSAENIRAPVTQRVDITQYPNRQN